MSRILFVIFALLAPVAALAQDKAPLVVVDGAGVSLDAYLWVARPLVVFADNPHDPRVAQQMALLANDPAALKERDVVVIADTDPKAHSAVREKLRPIGFGIVLIAKDGSVVLRKPDPWGLEAILQAVDALPLRKEEAARQWNSKKTP